MERQPIYLSPKEFCERYGGKIKEKTLANWRTTASGPKFVRLGGRILYPLREVEKWEESRTVKSTSEYSA